MTRDEQIRAYLRFTLAEGVGAKTFARLMEFFGGIDKAASAGPAGWKRVHGVGPKLVANLQAVDDARIDEELAEADRLSTRILPLEDPDYPPALKTIPDPPPVLYVRGILQPTDAVALAVVGSRRCTHYGMEQAERFGGLLARAGLTVISGGARGIDTAAHRGALASGGRTLAVMGCGLSHTYPPENAELFEQIVTEGQGALLSELPMQTAVLSGNFPTRNRIISGLSLGVLVVEAALPSGAMITAREAGEHGREVFALPGRVDSPLSAGTHQLLRDGAHLAADLDDILGPLGDIGQALEVPTSSDTPPAPAAPADMAPREKVLYEALAEGSRSLDELVRATDVPTAEAASTMTMLVIRGLVQQQAGNVFVRKR